MRALKASQKGSGLACGDDLLSPKVEIAYKDSLIV